MDYFGRLEKVIEHHGENSFLGGIEKPGAADYLVWPWIERTQSLKLISPGKSGITVTSALIKPTIFLREQIFFFSLVVVASIF